MKRAAKTASPSPATPTARKELYLSHFTPSMMQPETLQSMLVQRQPLLDACYDDVVHSVTSKSKHHHLFVGPRGIGKTHLISLLHHRLTQAPEVRKSGLLAWMREEEWGVTSFFELVLRVLRTLDQSYPALDLARQTAPLYELGLKQAEAHATSLLVDALGSKTLVVLVENLDDLFEQLGDAGQRQLRGFIQNHQQLVLIATTPSLFAGVSLQKSPFYGFFDIQSLKEFDLDDVASLLEKIAIERGDRTLADFIKTPEGRARIRAVHHLAEGNPRIYVIFAQFLNRESLDELVQAVMHTLDELTPYYQARMKELSGQQRKIVEYLVSFRGAAPVKQIAKACFITHQTCSGQLKQLRDKRYVRSIEQGRESYYELTEPLMRLCMEVKQQRGEPIGLFVEILRIWYTESELSEWLSHPTSRSRLEERYVRRALELIRTSDEITPVLNAQLGDLAACAYDRDDEKFARVVEEIALSPTTNAASRRTRAVLLLSMLGFAPGTRPWIEREIDEVVSLLQEFIAEDEKNLTNATALSCYLTHLLAVSSLIQIDATKAQPAIAALAKLLMKHPSHAAIAMLRTRAACPSEPSHTAIEKIFDAFGDPSLGSSVTRFTRIFGRIISAATTWGETGDDKHLLALSREERTLVLGLGLDSNSNRTPPLPA